MKITIVMGMPDMSGGAKVIALYADRLAKRGHDVVVVSAGRAPPTPRQRLRALVYERRWLHYERLPANHLDGSDIDHRLIDRYRPIVDSDVPDADVVVATWWQTAPWVAGLSARKGAKAYFMQDYGAPGMELVDLIPTWRLPMHIITIAQWLVGLMQEHGVDRPISVVPNSVETEFFHAEPRGKQPVPTVGFLYREAWVKGHDLVLEAFSRARARQPGLRLLTYGADQPAGPLPDGMEFRFRPATPDLRKVYAACDAWLFASRREGFGLPLLEAMACRTPVIAVPSGAAPELVEQGGGVMVKPEDPGDMADAIVRFAQMTETEWRGYSDRAFATVQGYTWDDAVTRFEQALVRTIELSRSAPTLAGQSA
jgi:glycosyltransferase involved in cell wall biosynthesis